MAALTADQELATKNFIEVVNRMRQKRKLGPVSWSTAVRFLLARKFDVSRAVALYDQHETTRQREGLVHFDPTVDPLRTELLTGKFTILPTRDATGAAIAVFTAHMHFPHECTQQTTLQGVVYQLDAALRSSHTQRAGLVFIYDMSNSKYSNFDYELSQKILTLLKGGYPAKLKKVLIVTAPLWFKAPFKILRLFVREKLRERVYTVSVAQLTAHIPRASLPTRLGGALELDHDAWLARCLASMTTQNGNNGDTTDTVGVDVDVDVDVDDDVHTVHPDIDINCAAIVESSQYASPPPPSSQKQNRNDLENMSPATRNSINGGAGDIIWGEDDGNPNPPSSASSGFSDDDSLHGDGAALTMAQLVDYLRERGRSGLVQEYVEIRTRPPDGSFNHARQRNNLTKNRYTDVLCFDHSRVLLSEQDADPYSDYIHANFVDGYKQKNAFISTQGPLARTAPDFWRMVWEQHSLLIVMTTRAVERGRTKCHQYWEAEAGGEAAYGQFAVRTVAVETEADYTVSSLVLTNTKTEESRDISHWQFTSWPDYGVPHSARAMLEFLERVRRQQCTMVGALGDTWAGHPRGPPIVVHCSAGIGRTGTFCTLDICISRLEDVGTADVRGTVERIRSQRAFSIQMPDQYVFCHLALIEYALLKNHLPSADLSGFDNIPEEESD